MPTKDAVIVAQPRHALPADVREIIVTNLAAALLAAWRRNREANGVVHTEDNTSSATLYPQPQESRILSRERAAKK